MSGEFFIQLGKNIIISTFKTRARKTFHEYGKLISINIKEAQKFDEQNNNTIWQNIIKNTT